MTEKQLRLEHTVRALVRAGNDATVVDTIKAEIEAGISLNIIADALLTAMGAARDAGPVDTVFAWIISREDVEAALEQEGHDPSAENVQKLIDANVEGGLRACISEASADALQTTIWETFDDEGEEA